MTAPHADADPLELGRRRGAIIRASDTTPGLAGEDAGRLGGEWLALDHRIMDDMRQTAPVLAVQLAVIWRDVGVLPGEENSPNANTSRAKRCLWQSLQNARRIGGVA